jgi:cyclic-di-AMP phosphodiesterase PgpH
VSYFHHKALTQLEKENGVRPGIHAAINDSDFRYPGPKPLTREAAIVLLADGVEAASRSLAKPTPHHIRNLIEELVNAKLQDGQLDMCALTLTDLNRIKEAFIFTLSNIAHSRIPYPKNENRDSQSAVD